MGLVHGGSLLVAEDNVSFLRNWEGSPVKTNFAFVIPAKTGIPCRIDLITASKRRNHCFNPTPAFAGKTVWVLARFGQRKLLISCR